MLCARSLAGRESVFGALAVLIPVILSGFALVAFAPGLWWVFTTYGWVAFPALGTLTRNMTDTNPAGPRRVRRVQPPEHEPERELLFALREEGELTALVAASKTSLTVAEADERLRGLAGDGHLEVRVRGGGIFYRLWDAGSGALEEPGKV